MPGDTTRLSVTLQTFPGRTSCDLNTQPSTGVGHTGTTAPLSLTSLRAACSVIFCPDAPTVMIFLRRASHRSVCHRIESLDLKSSLSWCIRSLEKRCSAQNISHRLDRSWSVYSGRPAPWSRTSSHPRNCRFPQVWSHCLLTNQISGKYHHHSL